MYEQSRGDFEINNIDDGLECWGTSSKKHRLFLNNTIDKFELKVKKSVQIGSNDKFGNRKNKSAFLAKELKVIEFANDKFGNRKNKYAFLAKELKVIEFANEWGGIHVVTLHPYQIIRKMKITMINTYTKRRRDDDKDQQLDL
ncbi:hypothetical protein LIER_17476 [Lithospermum erythrorhizon]|uniref:Uncharacterized protein n=1 Tax=Lithospermum erythrorhizon TaxID=34254 RepID=A0AAV3QD57_LITER